MELYCWIKCRSPKSSWLDVYVCGLSPLQVGVLVIAWSLVCIEVGLLLENVMVCFDVHEGVCKFEVKTERWLVELIEYK